MDNTADFAMGYTMGDRNNGYGNGNGMWGMEWIFALLILPMIWGGNGPFGRNAGGNPVTEADLCNANSFSELKGSVGRLSDQVGNAYTGLQNGLCNLGYQTLNLANQAQRDLCTGLTSVTGAINQSRFENQACCCDTQKLIMQGQYQDAMNTSAIIQSQERGTQKVLDYLTGQENMRLRDENMRNYIQSQFCGVVRYPLQTTYATNCNPFFGGYSNDGCGCRGCC